MRDWLPVARHDRACAGATSTGDGAAPVDTNRRWIGASSTTPSGTWTNAPSAANAVFSAVNARVLEVRELAEVALHDVGLLGHRGGERADADAGRQARGRDSVRRRSGR